MESLVRQVHLFILATVAFIASCAQPYTMESTFDSAAADWARQSGSSSIHGQAFLKTMVGDVKTCAGYEVLLMPETPYFQELAEAAQNSHNSSLTNPDPSIASYGRKRRCDAQGNFAFNDLPAGDWIVMSQVRWQIPNGMFPIPQGATLTENAHTSPGQQADIILTR